MKRIILALLLACASLGAHAACSGSGVTWSCTSGTTPSQVNTAIGSATDGATLTFSAGSYSWGGGTSINFPSTKSIVLICSGSCSVTAADLTFTLPSSGNTSKLYQISGFTFTATGSSFFLWSCTPGGCTNTISSFRFDHNTVTLDQERILLFFGEGTAKQYVYGVIDHNTFTSDVSFSVMEWNDITATYDPAVPAPPLGTVNNMFLEDNTITVTSVNNLGRGCIDHWGGSAIVYRYNTSTNCRIISHGVNHGGGPSNFEIYNNTITQNSGRGSGGDGCYRCIHNQGSGTMVVFGNDFTGFNGHDGNAIAMLHYRDQSSSAGQGGLCDGTLGIDGNRAPTGTYRGYPCFRQPGRDVTAAYKPIYNWNNYWTDDNTKIDLVYNAAGSGTDYSSQHMQEGRDWYNSISANAQSSSSSPFNGTTKMGFGTLANRPTTCTTSSEAAFGGAAGVGYFATDQGSQGKLYTCSATNTWTLYYEPYTYPHPLVGGGSAPSTPSNFRFISWIGPLLGLVLIGGMYGSSAFSGLGAAARTAFAQVRCGRNPASTRAQA